MVAPSPEAAEWARQQFAPAAPEFTPQPQSPSAPQKSASQSQMQWHSLPDRPVDQGVVPGTVQEVDEDFVPEHLKPSPWPWVAAFTILTTLMGGGLWIWMEHRAEQEAALRAGALAKAVPKEPLPELPRTPPTTIPEIALEKLRTAPPDTVALGAEFRYLIPELFNAKTPEARQACVHEGAKYAEQIEAMFGPQNAVRPILKALMPLRGLSVRIPDAEITLLYRVTTATNSGVFVRLLPGADGKPRIDWPLFQESLEKRVLNSLKEKPDEPVWSTALLRPNHGFELPVAERENYHCYQLQTLADGSEPLEACVPKNTPLGRFMDRSTTWGQAYIARVLVRRISFGEKREDLVLLVDCEGVVTEAKPATAVDAPAPAAEESVRPAQPVK